MLAKRATDHVTSPATDSSDDLLTPPEAATLLKISERTLWKLTRDGKIAAARRFGAQWRYLRSELLAG